MDPQHRRETPCPYALPPRPLSCTRERSCSTGAGAARAARVAHGEGQRYDPGNFLLLPAMGPNVAGVIGTAVAAGYFISTLAGK